MGVEWGGTQLEFPSNPKLLCSETLWAIIKSHTIAYMEYLHFYPLTWTLCEVCTIDIVCLHLRWENRSVINWLACIYMFNSWRVYLGSRSDFLKFQVSSNTVSVRFSHSVVSDSLRPHELQHTRPPRPSPSPGVHPDSRPSSPWCHPAISSSVVPFSSCPQSLPASGSFPMSQLFAWGGQSTGTSALASFLLKKSQGWFSEWTGWISLQSKGLSRVFSNTTVQKPQFFGAQLSL